MDDPRPYGDDDDTEEVNSFNRFVSKIISNLTKTLADTRSNANNVYSVNLKMEKSVPGVEAPKAQMAEAVPVDKALVDVIDDGMFVRVIAELRGARKDDITISAKPEKISISFASGDDPYSRSVNMPCLVEPKDAYATYKNGILEVVLRKLDTEVEETVSII